MMLQPAAHTPHIMEAEVRGTDGSVGWGMTHPGLATADLWAQDADRRNVARLQLDRKGLVAIAELALEMAGKLPD